VFKYGTRLVIATVGINDGGLFDGSRHLVNPLLHVHLVRALGKDPLQVATGDGEIKGGSLVAGGVRPGRQGRFR